MEPHISTYSKSTSFVVDCPSTHFLQSMYYSNFVASKLNVWNSNGRHRLEEFLAKMGFSLEQCKQKYPFMSCQLRKRLRDQIEKYAEDYGLQDVFYGKSWQLVKWLASMAGFQYSGSVVAARGAGTRELSSAGCRRYVDAQLSARSVFW